MHQHDRKWFDEQIARLPMRLREPARIHYRRVYEDAYNAEPVGHKKENKARFAANTRLRIYVENVTKKNQGEETK